MLKRLLAFLLVLAPVAACSAQTAPAAAGAGPVEGVDYALIANPQLYQATPGKIEVVEVFAFTCGHCGNAHPIVERWKATLASDVSFHYVPAAFGGAQTPFAQAFYAAQSAGVLEANHTALFRAVLVERAIPPSAQAGPLLARWFAARGGTDEARFASSMNSFAVNGRVTRSTQLMQAWGIEVTPTFVVAGKYRVTSRAGMTHEDTLRVVDALVARERAAAGR